MKLFLFFIQVVCTVSCSALSIMYISEIKGNLVALGIVIALQILIMVYFFAKAVGDKPLI